MPRPLWLASASPRRRRLLEWAGFRVEVRPATVDESWDGEAPIAHARVLAEKKATTGPSDRVVLAADTVVHRKDRVFGKPRDREDAARILRDLSGAWHEVTTGVCVRSGGHSGSFAITTQVRFRELTGAEITAYLATGEADDKAGAYGIQGRAGVFVAEIEGSWTNVMGLPLEACIEALAACGVVPWA
ncbi:MAG: septum formation protein Maf [Deltaproteobacteria bacterium]|nr:septum formation protein Maf [Deltaproteobacteria bacterium]